MVAMAIYVNTVRLIWHKGLQYLHTLKLVSSGHTQNGKGYLGLFQRERVGKKASPLIILTTLHLYSAADLSIHTHSVLNNDL